MKQCIKCNKEKEDSEYHKRPSGVLYNTCKECKNKYYKERHYKLSQNIEWRVMRSEVNKKRYHAKKSIALNSTRWSNKHMEVTNERRTL
jgi:hypothetical protein